MATEIEIKFDGLKVKHLVALSRVNENNTTKEKADILSYVYNIDKSTLYRMDVKDMEMLWDTLINEMKKVLHKPLRKLIEINGKRYKLINIDKLTVGWVIDYTELCKDGINPEHIMSLCYIDETLSGYHDEDNDVIRRANEMLEADLQDYLALSHFFFLKFQRLSDGMERLLKIMKLKEESYKHLFRRGLC